jgi:hypothetical protein
LASQGIRALLTGGARSGVATGARTMGSFFATNPIGMFLAGVGGSVAASTAIVNPLNKAMPQIRNETEAQLQDQRIGRVRAIVRAAERSYDDASFKEQLGPKLAAITDVKNGAIPGFEPGLSGVRSFFESGGRLPLGFEQQPENKDLVAALKQALGESPLRVQVEVLDASGNPNDFVVAPKGAQQ